jgi:hypothetical protein
VTEAVVWAAAEGSLGAPEDDADVRVLQAALTDVQRRVDAATDLLLDPDFPNKLRVKDEVMRLSAERERLERERDEAIARRAGGSAFAEFRAYWQSRPEDDAGADSASVDRAFAAWASLPIERRRDIIKSKFRVTLGARDDADRVQVVPL